MKHGMPQLVQIQLEASHGYILRTHMNERTLVISVMLQLQNINCLLPCNWHFFLQSRLVHPSVPGKCLGIVDQDPSNIKSKRSLHVDVHLPVLMLSFI